MKSRTIPGLAMARGVVPWLVLGLGLTLMAVNLAFLMRNHSSIAHAAGAPASVEGPKAPTGPPRSVTIPEGKLASAAIAFDRVTRKALPSEMGVPGRIEGNQDRQVQMRPRAPGVIREVHVSLGQNVKKGQLLALLDSPEVGTARLFLRAKQRELATARTKAAWEKEVATNVSELIPALRKRLDEQHEARPGEGSHSPTKALENEGEMMEKRYADRNLGAFRAPLMIAAVEFDIAAHEEEKTGGLYKREIIGEHPAYVAKHTREGAEAKFRAALGTAKFDAVYQGRMAEQELKLAESNVIDAAQRLRVLGVAEDINALLAGAEEVSTSRLLDEDVTAYSIVAPFDATVIRKTPLAVPSQKIEMNDVLLELADLSTVWVMANIPESDFASVPRFQEGTIRLVATAYPGKTFHARLLSIGATVDPTTRTVPMLAETPNAEGLLKLGMFVRIVLDTTNESLGLTIPTASVVEIEGKKGVFVPESAAADAGKSASFEFREVTLGRQAGDRVEVLSGLTSGESVVSQGAFILKSEIILQNEGEDE